MLTLAVVKITGMYVALFITTCFAALAVGMLIKFLKDRIDARRDIAMDIAFKMHRFRGWEHLDAIFTEYAKGDYDDLTLAIRDLADDLRDPVKRRALFENMFFGALEELWSDPDSRAKVQKKLDELRALYMTDLKRASDEYAARTQPLMVASSGS